MSAQPDAFSDLGLIVFDGCHLLHPRDVERSRRSVDAMLAILNLTSLAPNADLLMLSAMMKNSAEIAAWIKELAERECLSLNLAWKPTRQVRGSVVYPANRNKELGENLRKARVANPKHVNAPAKVVRDMKAQPFGFFSLLQTWSTQDSSDYTLLPLLAGEHSLSTGRSKGGTWYLTPNGNQTAASIAAAAASSGLKTLVFVQSTVLAEASATQFRNLIADQAVELSDEENALYQLAAEEMGNQEHCYLDLEENGTFAGGAASHHALLLREERHLHESLFKRKVGINVLFATSTLAQGMNLPSEIVIIAGDSRFDQNEDKMAQLEAHELLNAAGRAGRAGEQSQGFVLVVPSRLVEYDDETKLINEHWMTLKTIFSQSDQCLDIDDPTTILFDHIHAGTILQGMPAYLISRLPPAGEDGTDTSIRNLIGRSLGAFRARQRGDENWVQSRIASAFAARKASELEMAEQWLGKVSGLTGVSLKVLSEIAELSNNLSPTSSSIEVVNAIFAWLQKKPEYFLELVRLENIETLFGGEYATFNTDRERGEFVLPLIQSWLLLWMGGAPLNVMEKTYPNGGDSKRCKHSRHFVLKLVPDLAFIAGLPALILTAQRNNDGNGDPLPIVLATLGASVREGCDSPESLAARINLGKGISRVAAHHGFEQWRRHLEPGDPNETFEITRNRVRVAADFTQILDS